MRGALGAALRAGAPVRGLRRCAGAFRSRREFWWRANEGDSAELRVELASMAARHEGLLSEVGELKMRQQLLVETGSGRGGGEEPQLAILIDADNTSHNAIELIMRETAKFGTRSARRIYGDWASPLLAPWRGRIAEHSLVPVQQFSNTAGKNSTDSTMIIDAMDLLHSNRYQTFVLVSSDADFTRLATRIREHPSTVIGVGRAQTPKSFVNACNTFITIETLERDARRRPESSASTSDGAVFPSSSPTANEARRKALAQLREVVDECADEAGWSPLTLVGARMIERDPSFDPRNIAHSSKLNLLFKAMPDDYEYILRGTAAFVRPRVHRLFDSDTAGNARKDRPGEGAET